jgi:superfamily II DNA or RNA helicase
MCGWTESTLRGAASWQAFKEGKALFEAGAAAVVKTTPGGFQGTVRSGNRLLRVSVSVHSPTAIETRCACPANQATGAVCAHAIAVGLAALQPAAATPVASAGPARPAATPTPVQAWDVLLPPNGPAGLGRGKLGVTLAASVEPPGPADQSLAAWLAEVGAGGKSPLHLPLEGPRLASFLVALTEHPRVTCGPERRPLEIQIGGKILLQELSLQAATVRLVPSPQTDPVVRIADDYWQIGPDLFTKIGPAAPTAEAVPPPAALLNGRDVELPVARFLSQLEAWQQWLRVPSSSWLDSLHFIPAPVTVALALEGSLQQLNARLEIHYPDCPSVAPGHGSLARFPRLAAPDRCEVRNLAAEDRAVTTLREAGFQIADPAAGEWTLHGEPAVLAFLTQTLPALRRVWSITESTRFSRAHQQVVVVKPKLEILGSGEDWLSFDLSFETSDGSPVSAAEVQRLLRSGGGQRGSSGGRRLVVSSEISDLLNPLFAEVDLRQQGGHFTTSAIAGELILEIRKKLDNSQSGKLLEEPRGFPKPASLQADLRPYQSQGAAWLVQRLTRFQGALLADDMGLGKTIQTIALIEHLFSAPMASGEGRVLVVATTSLLGNWRAELARFAPGRKVRLLHGAARDAHRERVADGEVLLTSYATLARDLAWHLRQEYALVVADEASLMRNPDTDHANALYKLRAARRVALTGTPVENSVRDLWSIFRFLLPGWLGSREEFRERYEQPLAGSPPDRSALARLQLKTAPFVLRRTKEQVAPELPAKLFIDECCELSAEQQATYRQLLSESRKRVEAIRDSGNPGAARMQLLTALLRLRQTCCDLALLGNERLNRLSVAQRSGKLERLLELLREAVSGDHKVLIFSQFRTQLLEIEKCVQSHGWASLRLDGQTRNRQELVDRFQAEGGPPLFLISLKAGGYGLNLTAADIVVHFDPWWNPAAEAQATDRAHRLGQTRPVTVYRLLTRGTVEEKVVHLQARKRDLAAAIDESGAGGAGDWSEADLLALLTDAAPG